ENIAHAQGANNYHMEMGSNGQLQAMGDNGASIASYNTSSHNWEAAGTSGHVTMDSGGQFHAMGGQNVSFDSSTHAWTS
ncbi:hypothetical protein ABTP95_21945, partial [Acinetobacter baumannii]